MCSSDSGLWCWDATTQAASDDAPSQRRGWRGVLCFSFEVRVRQGRVTLPCKSLRGVRAPNNLIWRENHFNFIKMHYMTHFASRVWRFGFILMYSTEIGELAYKDQIKDGYRRSNTNEAARQIWSHYGRQHALGIRLQTIEALSKVEGVIVVEDSGMEMPTVSSRSTPCQVLKGRMKNTSMPTELCTALDIHYSNMMEEILCFIRQTAADDRWLPADPAELRLLPVEGFAQLEIPVPNFEETDRLPIHRARCTGTKAFRNGGSRNNWVWVLTGGEANYGD